MLLVKDDRYVIKLVKIYTNWSKYHEYDNKKN